MLLSSVQIDYIMGELIHKQSMYAVFHHYNKCSKKGEWKSLWLQLLDKHRSGLDMSSVSLDGSHTPATYVVGRKSAIRDRKNARRLMPFILQTGKDNLSPCPPRKAGNIMTRAILLL